MAQTTLTFPLKYRLAFSLELSGMDRPTIARSLGVHVNTIHNYLAGRQVPKHATLIAWAALTGVSVDWLTDIDTEGGEAGPLSPWITDHAAQDLCALRAAS